PTPSRRLVAQQQAVADGERIYSTALSRAETGLARALLRLRDGWGLLRELDGGSRWEAAVAEAERASGLTLSPEQRQAVVDALRHGVFVITGGPGTGKTTILRVLLACLEGAGLRVQLACPTGRAAQRLREATGRPARTVHRLLEFGHVEGEGFRFQRNEYRPLAADAVIVDEASMLDLPLAYQLARAIAPGTRLILVGVVDQLPPVGRGHCRVPICLILADREMLHREQRQPLTAWRGLGDEPPRRRLFLHRVRRPRAGGGNRPGAECRTAAQVLELRPHRGRAGAESH